MLKTPLFACCTLAACLSFTSLAYGQSSPPAITVNGASPDTFTPKAETPQDIPLDDKDIHCPTALEPILPGDYYACEARAAYGREDYPKMIEMLQDSAYWANKDAQYSLGLAYFNGDMPEIPQNKPLGLAWLAFAAERKNSQYQLPYASARAKSTQQEILKASQLWRQMRQKYGDSVAAPRAIRRFNHGIQPIDDAARDGGIVYLQGFSPYSESAFSVANKLHDEAAADFDSYHGTVVVGKPKWVQNKPAQASSAAGNTPSQQ
jgi:hypothetical protein